MALERRGRPAAEEGGRLMPDAVTEDIRIDARITKWSGPNERGFFDIEIDHPSVPRPATTKQAERAEEAKQLFESGKVGHIAITKKVGPNINPHTNKPYVDYYWEHGEPVAE